MVPSSIARQVAGTLPDQLAHLRMDLARFAAKGPCAQAGRGIRMPVDLAAWLREMSLPADVKSPKAVRVVWMSCRGRFGDGLKTADVARMADVPVATAQSGLYSLQKHGRLASEIRKVATGRALFWMEVV